MLFTPDETELLEEAREEPADASALLAAYAVVLAKAGPLGPDGWYLHGPELIPHVRWLALRAVEADAVEKIDAATYSDGGEASDEAVIAALGPGMIFHLNGRRYYRPAPLVELRNRAEQVRQLESDARVLTVDQGDGESLFTILPEA